MRQLRKIIAATTLLVMASGTMHNNLEAQEYCYSPEYYCTDAGGWGYEDSISSPSMTPYIALGTVLIVAIVALAVRHHGHHHDSHSHCH